MDNKSVDLITDKVMKLLNRGVWLDNLEHELTKIYGEVLFTPNDTDDRRLFVIWMAEMLAYELLKQEAKKAGITQLRYSEADTEAITIIIKGGMNEDKT